MEPILLGPVIRVYLGHIGGCTCESQATFDFRLLTVDRQSLGRGTLWSRTPSCPQNFHMLLGKVYILTRLSSQKQALKAVCPGEL